MRKPLQIVPVLVLFAVGAPRAHAQTIVKSDGIVTGIDNLTSVGTTYDVTFVVTDSPTITFTGSEAATAPTERAVPSLRVNASGCTWARRGWLMPAI